jgi:hypothetical protein
MAIDTVLFSIDLCRVTVVDTSYYYYYYYYYYYRSLIYVRVIFYLLVM